MGRKPKKKDIAEYLWHSEPTKINATNDNWRIRYGYLDSEGKEHQTTETVNNERAKNQFVSYLLLREKEHKAAKGTTVASKVDKTEIETVEQLLYAYAEHTKYLHTIGDRYGWDEGTYRANIGKIRNYIVPVFGSFPIWKITRVDMRQGFKDMLQLPQANGNHKANGARVSQRTVYDCKKIISRAFKYATDDLELITENPMLGVTVKQPKSSRREVWTEEQFNFAYDNCSDPQLKLLISLMVALSSRIGECLALTWSDVYDNEDKHEPSYIRNYKELTYRTEKFIKETNGRGILKVFDQVRSTRPDAKRRAVFHVTKTEKEIEAKTDRIYIAPEVIFMLRDYRLVQNQHKQLAGDSYIDDDLIFAHEDGTHISSQYADDMFRSLYEPLGLPKVDLYSLRHFSITKKLDYNRHDYVSLAKDTAHRQLSTIQDYYETPEDSVRIDTAKAIGKFLSRSGKSDSESKVTISLKDEDFAKNLRKWLLIQPENRCLSLPSPCTKRIIRANKGHPTPTVFNAANHLNI